MGDRKSPSENKTPVARWSRRERESLEAMSEREPADPHALPADPDHDQEITEPKDAVAALPPIDELTADSDFTPFLDRAVPTELRRLALRKLWLSDPVFANLDGLNDYDDDFRTLGVGKIVRTAYQVGKGMVTRAEQASEDATKSVYADEPERAEDDAAEDLASVETAADDEKNDSSDEA